MADTAIPRLIDKADGSIRDLGARLTTIGSARDCRIVVAEPGLPPLACHILFTGGRFHLQRLSPSARLTVNGQRVETNRELADGDLIEVGERQFVLQSGPAALSPAGQADPVQELIDSVVALLRNRGADVSATLVASVSRLLRCDAARLVVEDAQTRERRTVARFPQHAGLDRFSAKAIEWAGRESACVLMQDFDWQQDDGSDGSLSRNSVASLLCAALRSGGEILGYLYLDRLRDSPAFTEKDRRFCDSLVPLFSEILAAERAAENQRATIARLQDAGAGTGLIFDSEPMHRTIGLARRIARTESPVLITGETGTGKERLARFVHENSSRSTGPFRAVNCGAIPEALIESELFGHEKGAFTGAAAARAGVFEAARGGTLLLDEIGELPLMMQVKLLRVLQESEITRVGATDPLKIDVRVVAATNKDLAREVSAGRFRQDLYFRLNVLTLEMPPLRERGDDILLLADYFVRRYGAQFGFEPKHFSATARSALRAYGWPGNVRELENVVQKALVLSAGPTIAREDLRLPEGAAGRPASVSTLRDARAAAEKIAVDAALRFSGGNVSKAAELLDIDRKWLMKKMEELQVRADDYRKAQ